MKETWLHLKYFLKKKRILSSKHEIYNVFNARNEKKVLVSYICAPFRRGQGRVLHSNHQEAEIIASVFHELGYNVDVVEYTKKAYLDFTRYDVVFGLGMTFEESFKCVSFNGVRVHYATGAHVCHQNTAEIRRIKSVNKKYGVRLLPKRVVPWMWSMSTGASDAIVCMGNGWTKSTYRKHTEAPIFLLHATGIYSGSHSGRDISRARKGFLWFGSSGLVHKGLDLCLEAFSLRPDLELHICGRPESDVMAAFKDLLELPNVHFHGTIDVGSALFTELCEKCLFVTLPSCSEGESTSVITMMYYGLIPLVTEQCGIDVEGRGFLIESLTSRAVLRAIEQTESLPDEALSQLSSRASADVAAAHSTAGFRKAFRGIITQILPQ